MSRTSSSSSSSRRRRTTSRGSCLKRSKSYLEVFRVDGRRYYVLTTLPEDSDRIRMTAIDCNPDGGGMWVLEDGIRNTIPKHSAKTARRDIVSEQRALLRSALPRFDRRKARFDYVFSVSAESGDLRIDISERTQLDREKNAWAWIQVADLQLRAVVSPRNPYETLMSGLDRLMNEMFLYHVKLRTDLQKAEQRVAVSQTELRDAQKVVELSRHLVKDLQDDLFDKFRRALNSQTQRLVEQNQTIADLRAQLEAGGLPELYPREENQDDGATSAGSGGNVYEIPRERHGPIGTHGDIEPSPAAPLDSLLATPSLSNSNQSSNVSRSSYALELARRNRDQEIVTSGPRQTDRAPRKPRVIDGQASNHYYPSMTFASHSSRMSSGTGDHSALLESPASESEPRRRPSSPQKLDRDPQDRGSQRRHLRRERERDYRSRGREVRFSSSTSPRSSSSSFRSPETSPRSPADTDPRSELWDSVIFDDADGQGFQPVRGGMVHRRPSPPLPPLDPPRRRRSEREESPVRRRPREPSRWDRRRVQETPDSDTFAGIE